MKIVLLLTFLLFHLQPFRLHAFCIDKKTLTSPKKLATKDDISSHFALAHTPIAKETTFVTNPLLLQKAAKDTLHFINTTKKTHCHVVAPKQMSQKFLSLKKAKATLQFIIDIIEQDKKSGKFRILDTRFIRKHFGFIRWRSALKNNNGTLRITSYVTYHFKGSPYKTQKYSCALYALQNRACCLPYTKQEVLQGVLERDDLKNKVKPLVWLPRETLEEALMQGSIFITTKDRNLHFFNVDCDNGIAYNKKIKNRRLQKRYWYFRKGKSAYAHQMYRRHKKRTGVVFAGDIHNIGLGKVIALTYQNPLSKNPEILFGVLADTGGAFENNLEQLDIFSGIFRSKKALKSHLKKLPHRAKAYIVYKKGRIK